MLAPHLVQPVPFLLPLDAAAGSAPYVGAGMLLYDTLGGGHKGLPRHRHLTKRKALRIAPALRRRRADRRHPVLRRAGRRRPPHDDRRPHRRPLRRRGRHQHRASSASCARASGSPACASRDAHTGEEIEVRARQVDQRDRGLDRRHPAPGRRARQVPGPRLQGRPPRRPARPPAARHRADPAHREERAVRHPVGPPLDHRHHRHRLGARQAPTRRRAAPTSTTCSSTSTRCCAQPLTHEDVEGVYAGLRPLLTGESESTSKLSREHTVAVPVPGLVAVAGGKYTTYRVMARDAVDAAARGARRARCRRRSPTRRRWSAPRATTRCGTGASALARRDRPAPRRGSSTCCSRYGSRIDELLAVIAARPGARPSRCPGADDYLPSRSATRSTHEGALHLDDVLTRRTRISIETWDRGLARAEPAARLMAEVLGWDERHGRARGRASTARRVAAERDSQEQADDQAADVARTSAPDVLPGSPPVAPSPRTS